MAKFNQAASGTLPQFKWLDDKGREIPDPNPMEIPAGFKRPETLAEQVRRLVHSERLSQQATAQGFDTFEESEDFEIDDDMWDPSSPYEEVFDPVLGRAITPQEFRDNEAVYRERFLAAERAAHAEMVRSEALRARVRQEANPAPLGEQSGRSPEGGAAQSVPAPKAS